jgi:hypothetical protein
MNSIITIPPPVLPGSGSRVESYQLSSQPEINRLPVGSNCSRWSILPDRKDCQEIGPFWRSSDIPQAIFDVELPKR